MASSTERPVGPSPRSLAFAAIGWLGLSACLTMVFLGMRAVMDVGGSCGSGGPYVYTRACPDGAVESLMLGIFLGLGFGFLASVGGAAIGGIWAATPVLAWSALFGSLGWNFLDYGVFSAPPDAGIEWGLAICGIVFWVMAVVPLLIVLPIARRARPGSRGGSSSPAARPGADDLVPTPLVPAPIGPGDRRAVTTTSTTILRSEDLSADLRSDLDDLERQLARAADPGASEAERRALAGIAADFGAAVAAAVADTPVDPHARTTADPQALAPEPARAAGATGGAAEPEPEFTEGTQALLDRLERLADMRDRGLLGPAEYETAKASIMAELESRS